VQQPQARTIEGTVALIALLLANLVSDAALWWGANSDTLLGCLFLVAIGVPMTQVLLLAAWVSWGEGRWVWRLAGATVLTSLVGIAASWASGQGPSLDGGFVLMIVLFITVALLLPLRRLCGWRLTMRTDAAPAERSRFHIIDLLLWTGVIGLTLALSRPIVASLAYGDLPKGGRVIILFAFLLPPLLWPAVLAVFAPASRRRSVLTAGWLLFYGAGVMTSGTYLLYDLLIVFGAPGRVRLLQAAGLAASFFVVVPLLTAANCMALRALGWRLVRPGWRTSAALKTQPDLPTQTAAVE
jgi:hypothetical protein